MARSRLRNRATDKFRASANIRPRPHPIRDAVPDRSRKSPAKAAPRTRADGRVSLIERCQHRFACHVLKRGSGINQPSVEEDPAVQCAHRRSVSKGDSHGATRESDPSSQGRADPPLANSSLTIRRPGSSTTAYPRLPSSAINVDLPPLEHPEMTTNRSTLLLQSTHCWRISRFVGSP